MRRAGSCRCGAGGRVDADDGVIDGPAPQDRLADAEHLDARDGQGASRAGCRVDLHDARRRDRPRARRPDGRDADIRERRPDDRRRRTDAHGPDARWRSRPTGPARSRRGPCPTCTAAPRAMGPACWSACGAGSGGGATNRPPTPPMATADPSTSTAATTSGVIRPGKPEQPQRAERPASRLLRLARPDEHLLEEPVGGTRPALGLEDLAEHPIDLRGPLLVAHAVLPSPTASVPRSSDSIAARIAATA